MAPKLAHDRGSMSVESVLLAPLLVILLLFVVHVGRLATTQARLSTIADHAARVASQVHPRHMVHTGTSAARENAVADGLACDSLEVSVLVVQDTDPMTVSVSVACSLSRNGLAFLAPVPRQVRAESTEVIDRWRSDR